MVLSNASTSKIPKKWRIFTIAATCLILVIIQLYILLPLDLLGADTLNEELFTEDIKNMIITTYPNNTPIERPPAPKKQSILDGFDGYKSQLPQIQYEFGREPPEYTEMRDARREAIKNSFLHAWNGYKKHALTHDELKPVSNQPNDPYGGLGLGLIDVLGMVLMLEMDDEFHDLQKPVRAISFHVDKELNMFDYVTKHMGGLISAYELSDRLEDALIQRSTSLANDFLEAFKTPSGLPRHTFNPFKNSSSSAEECYIGQIGTMQLEFMMLSQLMNNAKFGMKAQEMIDYIDNMEYEQGMYIKGLYPTTIDTHKGRFKNTVASFGSMGDSVYEYFLKAYLLTEGTQPQYARMYKESIESMKKYMLQQVPERNMLMLTPFDTQLKRSKPGMEHLTCSVAGMLAIGSKTFNEPEDLEIAKGLMETCVFMYRTTATGLAPESWSISKTEPYNYYTFNKTKSELTHSRDWWFKESMLNPYIEEKLRREQEKASEAAAGGEDGDGSGSDGGSDMRKRQAAADDEDNTTTQTTTAETVETAEGEADAEQEEIVYGEEYHTDFKLPPVQPKPESLVFTDKSFNLHAETIESLFVLYRITGDQKYQEYAWEIYQAIEKWCKTDSAYAGIRNVEKKATANNLKENQIDAMGSQVFSQLFKYLYLIFSPNDFMSLDRFVFNTHGHALLRRRWNWDRVFLVDA